jgi:hypothetical protein
MRTSQLSVVSTTMAMLICLTVALPSLANASPPANGGPPGDGGWTVSLPAGVACPFAVKIEVTGRTKTISLPGGRFLLAYPGLNATLTNLDEPSRQVTLNITGAIHQTTLADGSVVTVSTGRSLFANPPAGSALIIGTWAIDAQGDLMQPPVGAGQILDACAMIE